MNTNEENCAQVLTQYKIFSAVKTQIWEFYNYIPF